ncbi:MAG TPA: aldo/keto reductase [Dehalococcoidia bacterium]|nr:aldo/keto reductase [Dehalococcoidia bacterium]
MQKTFLHSMKDVSRFSLGGGGIGQVWGATTREEAVEVLRAAVTEGITLIDLAPSYGNGEAENVFGEAFNGQLPENLYVTTKCRLGSPDPSDVYSDLYRSLEQSLTRMRVSKVDLMILHGMIIPDDVQGVDKKFESGTPLSLYRSRVRGAFQKLKEEGLIGNWGITGIGVPSTLLEVINDVRTGDEPAPSVIQVITNLLDSPRKLIGAAKLATMGTMGIRAVQAGALTSKIDRDLAEDHPDLVDFQRATIFRQIAERVGDSPARLAHRYALAMPGVDTVVLGVKNRQELAECIEAEREGPLSLQLCTEIDIAVKRLT